MIWGRYYWTTMHVAALGFPEVATDAVRQQYKEFYYSIGNALPCSKCKANFARHMNEFPIDLYLYDKNALFAWTVKFHNLVSKETGKNREWTVEEAMTFYSTGEYAKEPTGSNHVHTGTILLNVTLCIALSIAIVYILKKR